jgi:hypothetical protein
VVPGVFISLKDAALDEEKDIQELQSCSKFRIRMASCLVLQNMYKYLSRFITTKAIS